MYPVTPYPSHCAAPHMYLTYNFSLVPLIRHYYISSHNISDTNTLNCIYPITVHQYSTTPVYHNVNPTQGLVSDYL